jgi:dolichyl-phosphate-mannose-protein mannosyltransferase
VRDFFRDEITKRKILITLLVLFIFAEILFVINLTADPKLVFDENHYVPATLSILHGTGDPNASHPPLGKELIGVGISAFGDNPFGWRIVSTVFGSLTVLAMYLFALLLFRSQKTALWVAVLTCVNNLLFVQSRIAMLDGFMVAFLFWGMIAYWTALEVLRSQLPGFKWTARQLLIFTGVMMGLATACKWFAAFPLAAQIALLLYLKFQYSEQCKSISLTQISGYLIALPITCYFLTYTPMLSHYKPNLLIGVYETHSAVFGFYKTALNHPYTSSWWSWPLLLRPISYAFDKADEGFVNEIFLVGNPLIMWAGLLAIMYCLWRTLKKNHWEAGIIFASFAFLYFPWAFTTRSLGFFYYYFPPSMILSLALAYAFQYGLKQRGRWLFLTASILIFAYFYPVLSGVKIPMKDFSHWAWFRSWI